MGFKLEIENPILAAAVIDANVLCAARLFGSGITFVADSVATSYTDGEISSMFWSFSRVIRALKARGYALAAICTTRIALVDGHILIPTGGDIARISQTTIRIYAPPMQPCIMSPELAAIKSLPADVDYRGAYYSLASLIHGLTQSTVINGKIRHALARCLDIDPENRSLAVV